MKKTNKLLSGLLSAALMAMPFASLGVSPALAAAGEQAAAGKQAASEENQVFPYYFSYTGKVTAIADDESEDKNRILMMESDGQGPANPVLSKDCVILGGADIKVGDTVTVYYEANRPMILIYPPRYNGVAVVIQPAATAEQAEAMEADLFDKDLVSQSGLIKLTPDEKTERLDGAGQVYSGSLQDSLLLVFYQPNAANENVPEEVTPSKIIYLGKPETIPVESGSEVDAEEAEDFSYTANIDTADIVVEQKIIKAPAAFVNEKDVIMVPLRAIAEALDYRVTWEQDTKTVRLNSAISLEVGRDYYVYMRMAPIELGTAPVLKDGIVYVPLFYFRDVLQMNNAYFFENQVVVDNQEKMQ